MTQSQSTLRAFGVEEEYLLLDAVTGEPTNKAAEVIRALSRLDSRVEHEYFSSQVETSTPICFEAEEAQSALVDSRRMAAGAAADLGVVIAGSGLPPVGGDVVGAVTPTARYRRIEADMRGVAEHQYVTGTHVHVEVPSADAGVEVLSRIARWAPALLACTANSPLWCGEPTGFRSWRHIMDLTSPISGYPQSFDSGEDYERAVSNLIETGVILDTGLIDWVARLSNNYPTVEVRIADAQLNASDSVAFATIIRALVEHALRATENGEPRPNCTQGLVNGANWIAARNGLGSELIDPLTVEVLPAFQFVERMLDYVDAELTRFGDRSRVEDYLNTLRADGDPASRQLAAFAAGGVSELLELYASVASPE